MGRFLSRRRLLKGAAAAGVLSAAPAVIVRPGWSQTGPIKIGVLEPRSGPVKYVGDKHVAALGYAVEQVNAAGGLLGRKLEIVVADSEMKGDVATRRANDLIFSEKVDFLTGLGSTVGKAASQIASQNRKIFFTPTSEAVELTGEEFFDTTFRCTVNTEMHSALLAVYFAKLAPRAYEKEWEGAKFDMVWGEVEMRACDHQMQTPGYVAEVMVPEMIPLEIRYFGSDFPYIGRPVRISRDDIAQPARDTGNRRCA